MEFKQKIIIISIVCGISALILTFVLMYFVIEGIERASKDFIAAKNELVGPEEEIERPRTAERSYEDIEGELKKIDQLFVSSEVPIDLIKFWEEAARESNLSIEISPTSLNIAEEDIWDSLGFQINSIGSFPDFLKFLEKTETGPYLIEVQNLTIRKSSENIKATLITKVYSK